MDAGGLKGDQDLEHPLSRTNIMQCPTFINVYWDLNIKKICASTRGHPEPGAPCHGIIGILVNPALLVVPRKT